MRLLTDGVRTADTHNPKGYYEYDPVKDLANKGDKSWLRDARGKVVKIISYLLTFKDTATTTMGLLDIMVATNLPADQIEKIMDGLNEEGVKDVTPS